MDDTQRFYDLTAESTANEWYGNTVLLPTHRDFLSFLPHSPRILDLGCGAGYEAKRLSTLGAEVVGIDFSSECIRIASQRDPHDRFLQMDFYDISPALGTFHGVLAAGSLIHVPPERLSGMIHRIAGVLTSFGVLCAIVRDGVGQFVSYPVVGSMKLERIVYRYQQQDLVGAGAANRLRFLRQGVLDETLSRDGWRCYLLQKE